LPPGSEQRKVPADPPAKIEMIRLLPEATPAAGTVTWRLAKNPVPCDAVPTFLTKAIAAAPGVGVGVGVGVSLGVTFGPCVGV
jgi:hypothetical protein